MKKALSCALLALLPFAATAAEKNLSYSYFQVGYSEFDMDLEGEELSGDGFSLSLSREIGPTAFLFADYESASAEESFDGPFGSIDVTAETDLLAAGIGGAWGISSQSDFFARAAVLKADVSLEIDDASGSDDDTGYGLEFGLRSQVGDVAELFGTMSYIDVFDESETGFNVGARYWVTPGFGLSLAYDSADDTDGFTVAGRFAF